jgi:UPF0755 protein
MKRSRLTWALGVLGIVLGSVAVVWTWLVYLDCSLPASNTQVIIPRGSTLSDIATLLESRGVIRTALTFRVLARIRHADEEVRAGAYAFAPRETQLEILDQLRSGGAQIATWVTIPEGFTAAQIAERLQADGVVPVISSAHFAGTKATCSRAPTWYRWRPRRRR